MSVVLSISSQVVRGHVGNSATVFALERLGHTVWQMPTVVLSHHPGHGGSPPRSATPPAQLDAFLDSIADRGWLIEVDAVLVGYLADAGQAASIVRIVDEVRKRRPDAMVIVDPIMGDDGALYVSEDVARAYRESLMPLANLITPNRFELSWLAGASITTTADAIAAARKLKRREVVATSAPEAKTGQIRALLVEGSRVVVAESDCVDHHVHGVGDLMTALYVGHRLLHQPGEESLRLACAGVLSVVAETADRNLNELALAAAQDHLIAPFGYVETRVL